MLNTQIVPVTFYTKKSFLYKDCSEKLIRLRESLVQHSLELKEYQIQDLYNLIENSPLRFYLLFNRGVGGWFWKPLIIVDAMRKNPGKIVLYLDSDCVITSNPAKVISEKVSTNGLYLFNQQALIGDWTSPRCLDRMNANTLEVKQSEMKTAGIIVARSSPENIDSLKIWLKEMSDPLKLIEPIRRSGNHRHDQSVLSILAAQEMVDVRDLGEGFFSQGLETLSEGLATSWVATGNLGPEESASTKKALLKNYALYFKFIVLNYCYKVLILPIQVLLFRIAKM